MRNAFTKIEFTHNAFLFIICTDWSKINHRKVEIGQRNIQSFYLKLVYIVKYNVQCKVATATATTTISWTLQAIENMKKKKKNKILIFFSLEWDIDHNVYHSLFDSSLSYRMNFLGNRRNTFFRVNGLWIQNCIVNVWVHCIFLMTPKIQMRSRIKV